MTKVIGIFGDRGQAESAISQLRNQGFSREISILAKGDNNRDGNNRDEGIRTRNAGNTENVEDTGIRGGLFGTLMGRGGLGLAENNSGIAEVRDNMQGNNRRDNARGNSMSNGRKTGASADTTMYGGSTDSIADGSTTGSIIGGLAGLAAGAGALVIPGIGPLLAAGPIAGALTGAVTGGVAGGLVDWGIPEGESRRYEDQIKQGNVIVSVDCSEDKAQKAMDSLRQAGAKEVKRH